VPVQRFRSDPAARGRKGIDLWAPWTFPGPTTRGAHVWSTCVRDALGCWV
jgi:hypothetical protein